VKPLTLVEARQIVLKKLPAGSVVKGATEEGDFFLFLAPNPDPLEGHLDPFFSVHKTTGAFRDFSPQDFPNPVDILDRLQA
jgi:hypothetical protein